MTTDPTLGETPEFSTDEWVGWLDSVLSECRVDSAVGLVLEYHVSEDDGSVYCWHVRIASGRVSAAVGYAGEAPGLALVALASDRETALAIAIGGGSAQRAFAEGRLHVGGDPRSLLAARPALEVIGAVLAGLDQPST